MFRITLKQKFMNKFIRLTALTLPLAFVATLSFSQQPKEKTKTDRSQEIVIRKSGGKTEKMTIVVDGDNVTINGKPVDEFKTADVTVMRRMAPFPPVPPAPPAARSFHGGPRA